MAYYEVPSLMAQHSQVFGLTLSDWDPERNIL
jgi:hypothetical protein